MLKHEYLVANIGVDTAENELSKVCRSKQAIPTPGQKSGSGEYSRTFVIVVFFVVVVGTVVFVVVVIAMEG